MRSRYITFVLRMRLDALEVDCSDASSIHGSIQQVGREQIRHFNSFDKFLEIFRETVEGVSSDDPWKE